MFAVLVSAALTAQCQQPPLKFLRWEAEVRGIEKRLAGKPPAKGGIVFAGSSSIRLWDLPTSFPDLAAANAGFGGSTIPDCTFFAPRLVLPHEPKLVVFYAGDNDIVEGHTAERVAADFAAFTAAVHAKLPECKVIFLTVKYSPSRMAFLDTQRKVNALVKAACAEDERLRFVDTASELLGTDGKPDPRYFQKDELHLYAAGYERWAKVLGPLLK